MNRFILGFILFQAIIPNSNPVVLQTCCHFQSTYFDGKCTRNMNKISQLLQPRFPLTFNMGSGLNSTKQFQLKLGNKGFHCPDSAVKIYIDMFFSRMTSENKLFPEGYLQIGNFMLPPNEFCVNSLWNGRLELFVCNQTCQSENRCLPKCCPWGQVPRWLHPNLCQQKESEWISNLVFKENNQHQQTSIAFYHHSLNCIRKGKMVATASTNIFNKSQLERILESHSPGSYCLDDVVTSHDMKFNWNQDQAIFYCGKDWPVREFGLTDLEKVIYGVCLIVSTVFLMIAIVIYYIKLHRTHSYVHTWIEFCYMIFLLGFGLFYGLLVYFPETQERYCTLYHFIVVFGYLVCGVSLFSWATLLSFDLFFAFKELRPLGLEMATREVKRLVWYCVLGFSFPVLVILSTFVYSYIYWKEAGFCIPLQFKAIRFIQGILLLINTFFFLCTFYLIYKHRRKAKFATGRSPKDLNQLVSCFVKLFIVSGITYGGVIFSYVFGTERDSSWYLIIFRTFLNLRGVTVFFIYACNPQMKKLLLQRYQDGIFCGCIWCKEDLPKNRRMASLRSTFRKTDVIKM